MEKNDNIKIISEIINDVIKKIVEKPKEPKIKFIGIDKFGNTIYKVGRFIIYSGDKSNGCDNNNNNISKSIDEFFIN